MIERLESRRMLSNVIVKYTYFGDANLDGTVSGDDYSNINGSYSYYGDFNYDGQINADDYVIIDNAIEGSLGGVFNPPKPVNVTGTAKNDRIIIFTAPDFRLGISVNGKVTQAQFGAPLKIFGNGGDDVIAFESNLGNVAPATIYGGGGNDTIFCGGGSDRVFAGDDNDLITCGDGKDTVYGEGGDDSIRGGGSSDNIDGGDGADTLRGDGGNDRIGGGANPDRIRGSLGNDTLEGGGGRDILAGEKDDDLLSGGAGADVCDGGEGADVLRGGADHDFIPLNEAENDDFDFAEASAGECTDTNVIVGSSGLQKSGAGTLTLSGSNTYSGNTTINAGTLAVEGSQVGGSTGNITVNAGVLSINADHLNHTGGVIKVGSGAAIDFSDATNELTVGGLELEQGAHLVFNVGTGSWANAIHVTNPDGLKSQGAIIKIRPHVAVSSGQFTLIDFSGSNLTTPVSFTLAKVADTDHTYSLHVDQAAGKVVLTVAHV